MPKRDPHALALTYFRTSAGLSMQELARRLGHADKSLISAYERGAKVLSREHLNFLVEQLGYHSDAVDVFLFADGLIHLETPKQGLSPGTLSLAERHTVTRAAMAAARTAGRIAAEAVCAEQTTTRKIAETQRVQELAKGLLRLGVEERRAMVEAFPELWTPALAVQVCEASVKSAPNNTEESLELAQLAVSIAERVPGEEDWRSRLLGYCWAHVGNARRVANDLSGAEKTFAQAWQLWGAGEGSDSDLVSEWRLLSLEASLRRAQRQFSEALELLTRARACQTEAANPSAKLNLLLKEMTILSRMGEPQRALDLLREAAPLCEASGDRQLLLALRFNIGDDLCQLERFEEAAQLLPQVRELAFELANELDLIRVQWLSARVAAGQGRIPEAMAGLEQVSADFTDRKLPYNAALSSLDLAVLLLKTGRTAEVKRLALAMGSIFKAKRIDSEALASLSVFCHAAQREAATVEMALRARAALEQASLSVPAL